MASPLVTGIVLDRFSELCDHPIHGHLDQIPVVDGDGHIIGVSEQPVDPSQTLGESMTALAGDMLVSLETPILSLFNTNWVKSRFLLVVDRCDIAGIVTPSDLNKIQVHSALFSALSPYEDLLTMYLEKIANGSEAWLSHVPSTNRIERDFEELSSQGFQITKLRVAYLSEKHQVLVAMSGGCPISAEDLRAIKDHRNKIAHGNPLVNSVSDIVAINKVLKDVDIMNEWLEGQLV